MESDWIFFFVGFFGAMIFALSYIIFLYTYKFKEEIPLLSGEHIQVKFLNGDVSVDKEKFMETMKGNETFVCLDGEKIVYMTKVADLKYLYEHVVSVSHNLFLLRDYSIRSDNESKMDSLSEK